MFTSLRYFTVLVHSRDSFSPIALCQRFIFFRIIKELVLTRKCFSCDWPQNNENIHLFELIIIKLQANTEKIFNEKTSQLSKSHRPDIQNDPSIAESQTKRNSQLNQAEILQLKGRTARTYTALLLHFVQLGEMRISIIL